MDILSGLLKEYGASTLVLLVCLYVLLNSRFTLQYPRNSKEKDGD